MAAIIQYQVSKSRIHKGAVVVIIKTNINGLWEKALAEGEDFESAVTIAWEKLGRVYADGKLVGEG